MRQFESVLVLETLQDGTDAFLSIYELCLIYNAVFISYTSVGHLLNALLHFFHKWKNTVKLYKLDLLKKLCSLLPEASLFISSKADESRELYSRIQTRVKIVDNNNSISIIINITIILL